MIKVKNKKGQENTSISKIIVVIIVLLVVIVLALFLFKSDIVQRILNLPGYQAGTEDKPVQLNDSTIESVSKLCPNVVATINGQTLFVYMDGRKTNFYLDRKGIGSKVWENLLYLQYTQTFPDSTVAELPIYQSVKVIKVVGSTGNPSEDSDLQKLNGAFIYFGRPTEICKIQT